MSIDSRIWRRFKNLGPRIVLYTAVGWATSAVLRFQNIVWGEPPQILLWVTLAIIALGTGYKLKGTMLRCALLIGLIFGGLFGAEFWAPHISGRPHYEYEVLLDPSAFQFGYITCGALWGAVLGFVGAILGEYFQEWLVTEEQS